MARLEAGEVEEGRRLLEQALQAEPGSVEILHGLARAMDLSGERARALELFEQANALAPTAPGPAADLAMLLLERGEEERAAQVMARVLGAEPDHPRANLLMAMALAKVSPDRARQHAAKALRDPDPSARQQAEVLYRTLVVHSPS